jgi:hypothetical protein
MLRNFGLEIWAQRPGSGPGPNTNNKNLQTTQNHTPFLNMDATLQVHNFSSFKKKSFTHLNEPTLQKMENMSLDPANSAANRPTGMAQRSTTRRADVPANANMRAKKVLSWCCGRCR